jgi:hypothetical protein
VQQEPTTTDTIQLFAEGSTKTDTHFMMIFFTRSSTEDRRGLYQFDSL